MQLYLLALLAFLNSFSSPAYKAFTKEIIKKDDIVQVNSYLQISSTMVKIIVPLVAIAVYHAIGIHGVLLLDGISFIVSGLILLLIVPIFEKVKQSGKFSLNNILIDIKSGF